MLRRAQHDAGSASDYALRLLAIRPRSIREMRDRLQSKGYERPVIEATVAELCELGLLDDRKFAAQWVESRMALRPMGPSRLRAELLTKGVDRGIVEATLSKYSAETDERSEALALARKKIRTLQGLESGPARRRLAGFLGRRGFESSTIAEVLKTVKLGKNEV